ncbi:ABC transporter ATP-binding protein [Thermosediminibacter litoriperuensis]|uniref:Amino acid/amide ABC transporter ATP-binding protein 1, HAAT family (TC 3.A.1.4.-) n=1 Tax=Thermosediminibacter litoriperuensis TaxID=291989 RepID=A0A5S5AY39_9FIRM|nr:ABC transporter ATP-binding protein [Thermosediminibacter litoriperuensis]TYP58787.1 amino acid/amide ABC transporter ATP-binding protein 1, HAAT family (TC 3.A.1.4.-) [Thermosediminibacter litoriperuensis]
MALLELKGVTKRFGGIVAVKDISFALEQNEIVGLIGPNGAGKTTIFNLITGVYKVTGGKIFFDGKDITDLDPVSIVKCGIARTFQNIRLFNKLSVIENIRTVLFREADYNMVEALFRSPKVTKIEKQLVEKAMEYLKVVELEEYANYRADSLPYGLQRKLEIARALALKPRLLLLDEPAAGMNPEESLMLVDLIRKVKERYNLTIILIEHHMDVVMELCPRIIVINFGEMLIDGTKEEVQSDPRVLKAYLGEEYTYVKG